MTEKLISIKQMCNNLSRDRRTLWAWVKDGKFPQPLKHEGRTLGWTLEAYKNWLSCLEGSAQ